MTTPNAIRFTILGEPASKANSREIGVIRFKDKETGALKQRPSVRKSDKALNFERDALRQIPPAARLQLAGPVRVTLRIYYATQRPDLDESVAILRERTGISVPTDGGIDFCEHFVRHPSNHRLAKTVIYTKGKTPEETRDEIIGRVEI